MTNRRVSKKSDSRTGKKKSTVERTGTSARRIPASKIQENIDRNKREKRTKLEKVLGPLSTPQENINRNKQRTPTEREKELGKKPKLERVLGKLSVNNQKDLGEALAQNNLPAFLGGLAQVTNIRSNDTFDDDDREALESSQSAMSNALKLLRSSKINELTRQGVNRKDAQKAVLATEQDSPWVSENEIKALLSSPDKAKREAGEKVMEALLKMCKYPKVIAAGIEAGGIAPAIDNLRSEQALDQTQFQTGVIKWLRSNLTNVYFQSALMEDLQTAIATLPPNIRKNKDITIKKYIANVGFNRLMSGQNMFGASLSSDIDFKLVLDDEQLAKDLGTLDPEGFNVTEITKAIREVLKTTQEKFKNNFPLSLEVEDFTVKSLSTIKKQAQDNEKERNFLATVLNNQTLMSGNSEVQDKLKQVISDNLAAELAKRTWTQNLGESDKGSMEIIKALPSFEQALSAIGNIIEGDIYLKSFANQIISDSPKLDNIRIASGELSSVVIVTSNPVVLADLLKDEIFRDRLLQNQDVVRKGGILDQVAMFKGDDSIKAKGDKLDLIAKLTKNFTEDGSRNFIGREDLNSDDWIYSVKFAGCRLFDMFDQTTVDNYIDARDASALDFDEAELRTTYNGGKQIASAINAFSVQLQNRIYEFYLKKGKNHENIDSLYPRITASEFEEMLELPESRSKLNVMLESLLNDLGESDTSTEPKLPDIIRNEIRAEILTIKAISNTIKLSAQKPSFEAKTAGLVIFDALFQVANKTAQALKPPSN